MSDHKKKYSVGDCVITVGNSWRSEYLGRKATIVGHTSGDGYYANLDDGVSIVGLTSQFLPA